MMKQWRPRVPTAKPTEWHKDKTKYERRLKHKHDSEEEVNDTDTGDEQVE